MVKVFKGSGLEEGFLSVKLHEDKEVTLGGGFTVEAKSLGVPYVICTIIELAEDLRPKYKVGDTLMLRPSKATSEMEYEGVKFSLITRRDIYGQV